MPKKGGYIIAGICLINGVAVEQIIRIGLFPANGGDPCGA